MCQSHVAAFCLFIYLWFYISLNTVQSYHVGELEGQRKPEHTVGQGSVL